MADIRKFLDQAGVSTLWSRISDELEAKQTAINEVKAQSDTNKTDISILTNRVVTLESNQYDDSEIRGLISTNTNNIAANTNAIATLNGDANVEGSVSKKVAEGIASVVAGADASFDTLKEIADWIVNDVTGAASMANKISALETLVGNTAVATQIANAIETALKVDGVDKYALASDLTALAGRVATLEGTSHTHDNKALLDTYTQTEVDLADAVAKKHSHANKTILDAITDVRVATWDATESNANSYTDTEIAKIQALTESEIDAAIASATSTI